jgi:hypothetical protein
MRGSISCCVARRGGGGRGMAGFSSSESRLRLRSGMRMDMRRTAEL